MTWVNKQKVEIAFDKGAESYDWAAVVQRDCAEKLMEFCPDQIPHKILEIGCGTGFLTKSLIQKYPDAQITAIDLSQKMIDKCQAKYPFINFEKADGEIYEPSETYDLIISNLTVQWFQDPIKGIARLKNFLNPNGKFLFSTLGQENFYQWRKVLSDLGLPATITDAPHYPDIIHEEKEQAMYQYPVDFIKNLKLMGASYSDTKPLLPGQLKKACDLFQSQYCNTVTWHVLYGSFKQPA